MSVQARDYQYGQPKVDFAWLSDGWRLFKQERMTWIVAAIIAATIYLGASAVISAIFGNGASYGDRSSRGGVHFVVHTPIQMVGDLLDSVLWQMLWAGMFRMALMQIRGKRIDPVTFLSVRDVFVPLVCLTVLTYVLEMAGLLACIVPGMVLWGLFLFAPLYVVAEGAGPIDAMKRSVDALKTDWFTAVLFVFLTMIWIGLSVLFCGVGEFAAMPQVALAVAVGFCRFHGIDIPRTEAAYTPISNGYGAPYPLDIGPGSSNAVPYSSSGNPYGGPYGVTPGNPYGGPPVTNVMPPSFGQPVHVLPAAPANYDEATVHTPSCEPPHAASDHQMPRYRIPRPSLRPPRRPS